MTMPRRPPCGFPPWPPAGVHPAGFRGDPPRKRHRERDDRTGILFRIGMQSLTAGQQTDDDDARRELYDRAIAAFRLILVNRPELVRVRLELARAFFLKGQDGLARRHFELVLAGGVPPPVAANIRRFMTAMQTRKRFTGYFGAAVAPDSNLNAASESEIIYIDTTIGRLPFTRQGISAPAPASASRCGAAASTSTP